jgi:hypothetical protein
MNHTNNYTAVYDTVGLDPVLRDLAIGRITLPLMRVRAPFACYGFPPALIPIWSDGNSMNYVGLWKHWFCDRRATFVECLLEEDCRVYEIARTPSQLLHIIGLEILSACEGDRSELTEFARICGGGLDVDGIERVAWQTGDDPMGLLQLELFRDDPPLSICGDTTDYPGDFPDPRDTTNPARFRESCTLEVPATFIESLRNGSRQSEFPVWFREYDVSTLFDKFLGSGDVKDAWLVLNCHDWDYPRAKQALANLRHCVSNDSFSTLTDAWLSFNHETGGGY